MLLYSPVYVTWVDRSEDPAPALVNTVRILHPIFSLSLRCFTLIHMHSGVQGHQEWSARSSSESSHQQ